MPAGFCTQTDDTIRPMETTDNFTVKLRKKFQFSSALKRMSTVSQVTKASSKQGFIAVKGAPETLRSMYTDLPANYDAAFKYYTSRGSRVIALGYKNCSQMSDAQVSFRNLISSVRSVQTDASVCRSVHSQETKWSPNSNLVASSYFTVHSKKTQLMYSIF